LDCRKGLNQHINCRKGGKSGRRHAWIMDKDSRVITFEKLWTSKQSFCYVMANKKIEFVTMSLKAKCGPLLKLSLCV
jgi:hypothetical protein